MIQSKFSILTLLSFLFILFISCDTEDPFNSPPPDFSTVPEPYDTSGVESVEISDGVKAYTHDEGYGQFQVTVRDQVDVFLTLRTQSGSVIYSTFSSDRTNPMAVSMGLADGKDIGVHQTINQTPHGYTILLAYTPGFEEALLGMREGEKTTLVIEPEKGYKNIPQNSMNSQYSDSTLIYDIQISQIDFTQKQ